MPLMYNKKTLAVKAESTYGTAETLTASEAIRVMDLAHKIEAENINREKSTGSLGTDIGVPGSRKASLSFWNFLHGDGSAGDPNWAAALFPAVGMPGSSNTYTTSSTTTSWAGMTGASNRDGRRLIGKGYMGNLKLGFKAGEPIKASWDFKGAVNSNAPVYTDTSQLSSISFETAVPPIFAGSGSLTIGGATTYKIATAEIDLNNQPFAREDPNSNGGYIGGWLNNPMPTIKLDPEAVAVATKDWGTAWSAASEITIILVANGGTGNTITVTCTGCQLKQFPEEQNRNGLLVDSLGFQINTSVAVAFT